MAKVKWHYPIDTILGKIDKEEARVCRQKIYRDENGRIMKEGVSETYRIAHPRDWKKNPATGAELRKINLWKQACAQTKIIVRKPEDIQNDTTLTPEEKAQALATLSMWRQRFNAQRLKGESESPLDPQTGKHLAYQRFDCFVRAALLREYKCEHNA